MNKYPRETIEFAPVRVTVDKVQVLTGVEFCVAERKLRPAVWVPPMTLDGEIGVMIEGLEVGYYNIWVRVIDDPEQVELEAGTIQIT